MSAVPLCLACGQSMGEKQIEGALFLDDPCGEAGDLSDRAFLSADRERMMEGLRHCGLGQKEKADRGGKTEKPNLFHLARHKTSVRLLHPIEHTRIRDRRQ